MRIAGTVIVKGIRRDALKHVVSTFQDPDTNAKLAVVLKKNRKYLSAWMKALA